MKLPMLRVQIVGLKSECQATIRALHQLGCIQIEPWPEKGVSGIRPYLLEPETIQKQEETTYLATRIESLLTTFGQMDYERQPHPPHTEDDCLTQARANLEPITKQVQTLAAQREQLLGEQASLPRYETTLRKLMPIVPPAASLPGNISIVVLVSRSHAWVLDAIKRQIDELTGGEMQLIEEDVGADTRAMLIVAPQEYASALETILGQEDISRLQLPDEFAGQTPDKAVASLTQRLQEIPAELDVISGQLAAIQSEWGPQLLLWRDCLRDMQAQMNSLNQLGASHYTFILAGWTPQRDIEQVRQALLETVGDSVLVEAWPPTEAEKKETPVALTNPAPARPFQTLVGMLSWPRYNGVDPTLLMAIFLPLFYGMILGDIGYGAIIFLLCLLGLRRFRNPGNARDILKILAFGALWAIVFGFLYGEFFGTLGEKIGLHPLWMDRASAENVSVLLLFSLIVGAVHITLGLIIGVWEAWQHKSRSHLMERGGMLIGLMGIFMLVAVLLNQLPAGFMTPSLAVIIIGIVILGASIGWLGILLGPIEFIGLIGNILSYLRIAAVGLASVYVALVANELAGNLGILILGLIVALLIHALNIALGALSPTIHSLRLHYVEFFRKFYEGGGRPFTPFKSRLKENL